MQNENRKQNQRIEFLEERDQNQEVEIESLKTKLDSFTSNEKSKYLSIGVSNHQERAARLIPASLLQNKKYISKCINKLFFNDFTNKESFIGHRES